MVMNQKLGVRLDASSAKWIALAAEYQNQSVSGFVRKSAVTAAEKVIIESAWGMSIEEIAEVFDRAEELARG